MRYSSRFFLYVPFVLLMALAAAAMLRWWFVAGAFENALRQANGHEIAPGVTLHFESERTSGFPFNLDTVMEKVAISAQSTRGPIVWRSEHFAIHALTYGRAQQIFEAAGAQTLSWTDMEGGRHEFTFVPGSLRASAISLYGRLVRFDLDIEGIGARDLSGAGAQLHLRALPDRNSVDVAISADTIHLAPALQAGFGAKIPYLTIEGRLIPAASFSALLSGREEWRNAAEKWRRMAGTFQLDRLDVVWGGVGVTANGNFALDDRHRLRGVLAVQTRAPVNLQATLVQSSPLARALTEVTKDMRPGSPLATTMNIGDGLAVLRRGNASSRTFPAGSVDAMY